MKNWGLDQIGFTVDPTLIFDMTKAKALYLKGVVQKKVSNLKQSQNLQANKHGFETMNN